MPNRVRTTLYETHLPRNLREAYTAARDDPKRMEMYDELGLLRTLLAQYIESCNLGTDITFETIDAIGKVVSRIAKVQTAISSHEKSLRGYVPVTIIPAIVQAIAGIIRARIRDEGLIQEIAQMVGNIPALAMKQVDVEVAPRAALDEREDADE